MNPIITRLSRDIATLDAMYIVPHCFYYIESRLTYRCTACDGTGDYPADIQHTDDCNYKSLREPLAELLMRLLREQYTQQVVQYRREAFRLDHIRTDV